MFLFEKTCLLPIPKNEPRGLKRKYQNTNVFFFHRKKMITPENQRGEGGAWELVHTRQRCNRRSTWFSTLINAKVDKKEVRQEGRGKEFFVLAYKPFFVRKVWNCSSFPVCNKFVTLNKNTAQVLELFIHDFDYKKFDKAFICSLLTWWEFRVLADLKLLLGEGADAQGWLPLLQRGLSAHPVLK